MFYDWRIDDQIELKIPREDFAPVYAALARENFDYLKQWLRWPPMVRSEEDFLTFIRQNQSQMKSQESCVFAIFHCGELAGNIAYKYISHELKKTEIGYWIAQNYQGKGIVTKACNALIEFAFQSLTMEKVEMCVADENVASRRVCERLNMTLEGIVSNAENLHGTIVSHAVYGLHHSKNC